MYAMEEPTTGNKSELMSTLSTLFNLLDANEDSYDDYTVTLRKPTQYKLLQELKVHVHKVDMYINVRVIDPEFSKWIVENFTTVIVHRMRFSNRARKMFAKTLAGETSKVKRLSLSLRRSEGPDDVSGEPEDDPNEANEFELAELIQGALTVKKLYIEIDMPFDLMSFESVEEGGDRCIDLTVKGRVFYTEEENYNRCLMAVMHCELFSSINYSLLFYDDYGNSCGDVEIDESYGRSIANVIRSNQSLMSFSLTDVVYSDGGPSVHDELVKPIFEKRKWQEKALELAPLLEEHILGPGLFGKLLCSQRVSESPRILYDIITANVPLVKIRPDRPPETEAQVKARAEAKAARQAIEERKAAKKARAVAKQPGMRGRKQKRGRSR